MMKMKKKKERKKERRRRRRRKRKRGEIGKVQEEESEGSKGDQISRERGEERIKQPQPREAQKKPQEGVRDQVDERETENVENVHSKRLCLLNLPSQSPPSIPVNGGTSSPHFPSHHLDKHLKVFLFQFDDYSIFGSSFRPDQWDSPPFQ